MVSLFVYVFQKPNPIVQIVYFICAGGGFTIYVINLFPQVPNKYMDNYHKYIGTVLMVMCYFSYYKACATDPGYFDKNTEQTKMKEYEQVFKFDGVLYSEK